MTHNGAVTGFEYDDEANLTRLLPPVGGKTDYEYYNDGRLYKVKHEANPDDWREYTYEYDDAGRLLRIDYPGGMQAHFTWDANGQLLYLQYVRSNSSHFYSFEYQYDESGNRVQMVESPEDNNDAITWDYEYDWLNRLVGVTRNGNPWRFYAYDESDNRIELRWPEDPDNDPYQLTTWSYSHDEADQLLSYSLEDGQNNPLIEEFTYDNDGNMIARVKNSQTTYYDWDHNNRLKRIRQDGQDPRHHHYTAAGIRDKRTLNGQKETFHTLSGVALADVRPSGPVAFVQGHQLLGLVKDGDLYHFISDGLGTVRWVTDDAVNPVASFACDPFGMQDTGGTSGNPDLLQHTYTGALGVRNDGAALGLYYAQQRYYDPHLGRWLTPDPIGFSGGLNLYTAMGNDPVSAIDPSGLKLQGAASVGANCARTLAFGSRTKIIDGIASGLARNGSRVPGALPAAVIIWGMANTNRHQGGDTMGSDRFDAWRDRKQECDDDDDYLFYWRKSWWKGPSYFIGGLGLPKVEILPGDFQDDILTPSLPKFRKRSQNPGREIWRFTKPYGNRRQLDFVVEDIPSQTRKGVPVRGTFITIYPGTSGR